MHQLSLLEDEDEDDDGDGNNAEGEGEGDGEGKGDGEGEAPPSAQSKSNKKKKQKKKKQANKTALAAAGEKADTDVPASSATGSADKPGARVAVGSDPASDGDGDEFVDAEDHAEEQGEDGEGAAAVRAVAAPSSAGSSKKKSKSKPKKNKNKGEKKGVGAAGARPAANKGVDDMTMDELDAILAEDQAKAASSRVGTEMEAEAEAQAAGKNALWEQFVRAHVSDAEMAAIAAHRPLQAHLACQARNFDPQVELARSFGAAAVRAYQAHDERQGAGTRAGISPARAAMEKRYFQGILNQNKRYKSLLVQPQLGWPPFQGRSAGLSMTEFDTVLGKRYSWLWSPGYKAVELEFIAAMHSVDPSGLYELIGRHPWHIHGLLQLSEVGRMQGDLGLRTVSLEKALYAMERTTTPSFHAALTSARELPRVTYRSPESRAFFLAAHKYVNCLTYKGTWRTALEWTKLVLGLDNDDPHAIVLWIDFLAIKTASFSWFLELSELLERTADMDWSPGWHYSKALAYKLANTNDAAAQAVADTMLDTAIKEHPLVAALVLQKNGVDAPSVALSQDHSSLAPVKDSADLADEDGGLMEQLCTQLYAHRMLPLWKEGTNATWLAQRLDHAYPSGDATMDEHSFHPHAASPLPEPLHDRRLAAVLTHLTVSDLPEDMSRLFSSLVPRHLQPQQNILGELDPFPPPGTELSERFFMTTA